MAKVKYKIVPPPPRNGNGYICCSTCGKELKKNKKVYIKKGTGFGGMLKRFAFDTGYFCSIGCFNNKYND